MGEARRRGSRSDRIHQAHESAMHRLAEEGRIIEGGWLALRATWLPAGAPDHQVRDLRCAFMAGAQHLFASILTILDPGSEATDADMSKMNAIAAELEIFCAEIEGRMQGPGSA